MKQLRITEFGNPILRQQARELSLIEIKSDELRQLVGDTKDMLVSKKLGIGLAAPQVGQSVALAVIAIRPSKSRPDAEVFDLVLLNPKITEYIGGKKQLWEGCISAGSNGKANLFAKVPRHREIKVEFYDETGKQREQIFKGLPAHVIQHEVDHLRGVLFVDRVKDPETYMTHKEYMKQVVAKRKKAQLS